MSTTLANTALWDENTDARRARRDHLPLTSRNAAAMTIGPMYYRSTIERAPTDSTLIEAVIAALGTWSTEWSPATTRSRSRAGAPPAGLPETPLGKQLHTPSPVMAEIEQRG